MIRIALAVALTLGLACVAVADDAAKSQTVDGTVRTDDPTLTPIAYAFVGVLTPAFAMVGQGTSDASGAFRIELPQALETGYIMVQPPPHETKSGVGAYFVQPRIFQYDGESELDLRIPPAGCIVLKAYNAKSALMRWKDFRERGTLGDQFMYLTGLDDRAVPAVSWPVFDQVARDQGQPRDLGLPALVTRPGRGYVPQVLFWDVPGYGRLLLRADNGGEGFAISEPGAVCIVELNLELARTAVHDIARSPTLGPNTSGLNDLEKQLAKIEAMDDAVARAAAADRLLAEALETRDRLEVAAAQASIPKVRQGTVHLTVKDGQGNAVPNCAVHAVQQSSEFLFGVFEGSPYNAHAFELARKAGFNLATVLLGWGWTDDLDAPDSAQAFEETFGIGALNALGYVVKAHGVVWLQDYGILPERARTMPPQQLQEAMLAHEKALLDTLDDRVTIWEAMNEPNVTNVVEMPRPQVGDLLKRSAQQIGGRSGLISLVNGAHEGDYGRRFALYALDNAPVHDWNRTYAAYLADAARQGNLNEVGVIGLQYYPGFHFNESFGGLQGPATTPSWFVDMVRRYAELKHPIHVTEFSIPSSYEPGWTSGYWREAWTETTQADYAEMIYTLAFGNPAVHSISWWDVTDTKSSVVTGGLVDQAGFPKPAFTRLQALLAQWTQSELHAKTDASGSVDLTGYGGSYLVEVSLPGGKTLRDTIHIREQESTRVVLSTGDER